MPTSSLTSLRSALEAAPGCLSRCAWLSIHPSAFRTCLGFLAKNKYADAKRGFRDRPQDFAGCWQSHRRNRSSSRRERIREIPHRAGPTVRVGLRPDDQATASGWREAMSLFREIRLPAPLSGFRFQLMLTRSLPLPCRCPATAPFGLRAVGYVARLPSAPFISP
jgi:hypothetical protein